MSTDDHVGDPSPGVRPPRRRRIRRVALVALLAGVAYALIGIPIFVFPPVGPLPAHADVALVLGPPTRARLAVASRLQRAGVVSDVLVSTPGSEWEHSSPWLASCNTGGDLVCGTPYPSTTRGEARMLRHDAVVHHWRSAVVITMPAHVERARMIVSRCFPGRVAMAESEEGPAYGWPYQYLYQTAATVKAWVLPGC